MKPPSEIVCACRTGERLIAIVPSPRVSAVQMGVVLHENGIAFRVLGSGSGHVTDRKNVRRRVHGVHFVAIAADHIARVQRYATLCGVTVTAIEVKGA